MQDKITIADAPDCLNTNDKAMWVLGYQAAIEARSTCLLQIQEPPTKTEALAHYSKQAILAMDEAAPAAVAVPDLWPSVEVLAAAYEGAFAQKPVGKLWANLVVLAEALQTRAALAATPAAPFMWAIQGPDGLAYLDEGCVNSSKDELQAEVDGLNSPLEPDEGRYQIVSVFLSAPTEAAPVVLPEPAMNEDGYLPCPFCGSDQVSKSIGKNGDGTPWPYVECESCAAMTEVGQWNERALLATGGQAQAVEVDDHMALAFHHAITDGAIGQDDLNEIKIGLRAVLVNQHAPQAQADARDAALLDFIESHAEGVIRLDAVPNYLYWGKHWEHKTARAAIAAAKGE